MDGASFPKRNGTKRWKLPPKTFQKKKKKKKKSHFPFALRRVKDPKLSR